MDVFDLDRFLVSD